jgi:hypothetical protein
MGAKLAHCCRYTPHTGDFFSLTLLLHTMTVAVACLGIDPVNTTPVTGKT